MTLEEMALPYGVHPATIAGKKRGYLAGRSFSERVIFRELFLNGLTLLDLKEGGQIALTLSHVAARQEVREMVRALGLPGTVAA